MLSAESAAGAYPVEAVATMNRIAERVEKDPTYPAIINAQRSTPEPTGPDAISYAAREIAETLELSAIVTYTASGATGLRAARERPKVPIIALSPILETARRLSLAWGTHCVVTEDATDLDDMVDRACRIAVQESFAAAGGRIIITAGVPLGTSGATNMLRIADIGAEGSPRK
jgi:pyruvate kinase